MKALSMKQPVPELIFQGKKTIETRTWKTEFLGEFLIHASQGVIPELMDGFKKEGLIFGAVLGKAEIVERKVYRNKAELDLDYKKHLVKKAKKFPTYGYILKNVKRFEKPIPMKGKLNFFEVDNIIF